MIDWGTAPAWVTAIGSLVAVIFAGLGARAAIRSNRNQVEQLRKQQAQLDQIAEDKHKEQASKVAVWCFADSETGTPVFRVSNESGLPIYYVKLISYYLNGGMFEHRTIHPYIPPGQAGIPLATDLDISKLVRQTDKLLAEIVFSDVNDVVWRRDPFGLLSRSTYERPAGRGAS